MDAIRLQLNVSELFVLLLCLHSFQETTRVAIVDIVLHAVSRSGCYNRRIHVLQLKIPSYPIREMEEIG